MRTIKKYFYLLAAVALTGMVSCVKEKEEFTPGDPDSETCEGVYFIKQDVIEETQIFDPTQEKKDRIIVRRTNSDGALTVTPQVSLTEMTKDGPTEGDASLFTVSDIVFTDGQKESYVDLDFSKVKEGVQYSLHLSIEGDEYSSKYSTSLKCCDYKVMCVAYKTFCQPKEKEDDPDVPAKVTFTQGSWGEVHTAYIKYYEVDGIRYCTTFDEETAATEEEEPDWSYDGGFWGQDENVHLEFEWYVGEEEECDCDAGSHPMVIPDGSVDGIPSGAQMIHVLPKGSVNYGANYDFYPYDYYEYYKGTKSYSRGFLHFIGANELFDSVSYYDGNGGFFFWIYGYTSPDLGWIGLWPETYDIVGIAEGYTRADYTLEVTAGMPEADDSGENVVPVDFELGTDVDLVAYTILKGHVSSALVNNEANAIVKDTISRKYATWVDVTGKTSFSDQISCEETGMYTLVAVAIDTVHVKAATRATDAAGVKFVYKNKNTASVYFKYLKAGDAGQVVLSVDAASTEGLESQGWDPEISLQYTIKGSGITGAIPMIYSQAEVDSKGGIDALVEELKSTPNDFYALLSDKEFKGALTSDQLACVNDNGFSSIYASGLAPGTMYYVVVWATNGYDTAVEYGTVTTAGDPLPIYVTYKLSDFDENYLLADASEWCGTWNMYGIDYSEGGSLRSYLGKSVITPSETPTEGPDEDGFYDEYVYVTGLFGDMSWLKEYGFDFDDRVEMDVYGGVMYYFNKDLVNDSAFGDCSVLLYAQGADDWGYEASYYSGFIPVLDGYYAFVDMAGSPYNFTGIGVASQEYEWLGMVYNQLLVDPSKDDNGVASAPEHIDRAIHQARANFSKSIKEVEKSGLRGKKAIHAAIDKYMKGYNLRNHTIVPVKVNGLVPTQTIQRVEAKHNLSISSYRPAKDGSEVFVQAPAHKHM